MGLNEKKLWDTFLYNTALVTADGIPVDFLITHGLSLDELPVETRLKLHLRYERLCIELTNAKLSGAFDD